VAVAAGLAALDLIEAAGPDLFAGLGRSAARLAAGLEAAFRAAAVPVQVQRAESLFSVFFAEEPVRSFADARRADHERFARFFHAMLDEGVWLPPSGYEAWFVGAAHGEDEIDRTLEAVERAARGLT
jgi:glutamate-1-semialdehyde 2,1-aminomutase